MDPLTMMAIMGGANALSSYINEDENNSNKRRANALNAELAKTGQFTGYQIRPIEYEKSPWLAALAGGIGGGVQGYSLGSNLESGQELKDLNKRLTDKKIDAMDIQNEYYKKMLENKDFTKRAGSTNPTTFSTLGE